MPGEPTRITDYAFRWGQETPEAVALTGDLASGDPSASGERTRVDLTYADLVASMDAWAGYFLAAGVAHGDRVALCTRPSPEAFVVYLAAASIGAVFQGLNPSYTADELRHVLADATPTVVLDAVGGPALEVAADLGLDPRPTARRRPRRAAQPRGSGGRPSVRRSRRPEPPYVPATQPSSSTPRARPGGPRGR